MNKEGVNKIYDDEPANDTTFDKDHKENEQIKNEQQQLTMSKEVFQGIIRDLQTKQ